MYKADDVVFVQIQFADTYEVKKRLAVILFKELGNVVVAGITCNIKMEGVPLTVDGGALKESIIKINYVLTIAEKLISCKLFELRAKKTDPRYRSCPTSELLRPEGRNFLRIR